MIFPVIMIILLQLATIIWWTITGFQASDYTINHVMSAFVSTAALYCGVRCGLVKIKELKFKQILNIILNGIGAGVTAVMFICVKHSPGYSSILVIGLVIMGSYTMMFWLLSEKAKREEITNNEK